MTMGDVLINSITVITVKVLFFGAAADAAGVRETKIELNEGSTVIDAYTKLLNSFHKFESLNIKFAVNQEHSSENQLLFGGEELALFTPVSGG